MLFMQQIVVFIFGAAEIKTMKIVQVRFWWMNTSALSHTITSLQQSNIHLNELYGEKIRKNLQWKVKEMVEAIKKELEIKVSGIKLIRLRKLALEGVQRWAVILFLI